VSNRSAGKISTAATWCETTDDGLWTIIVRERVQRAVQCNWKLFRDEGNALHRNSFSNGFALYAFDLTPDPAEDDHFDLTKQGASDSSWSLLMRWPTQWPWLLTRSFKRWSKSTGIATRFTTFRYEHLPDRSSRPSACASFRHFIKLWRFSTKHQSQVVEHYWVYVILRFNKCS